MTRSPDLSTVINGRRVHAWSRRSSINVLVFAGETAEGDPVGDWEMPKVLGLELAAQQAEIQTDHTTNPKGIFACPEHPAPPRPQRP